MWSFLNVTFKTLFFPFALLLCISLQSQPVISSFQPASGPAGTTVTINGSGFSTTIINNHVYFGPAKAVVLSASNNQLQVVVPKGTTYDPVTVTNNGLTGYSRAPFILTFPDAGVLANSNFDSVITASTSLYTRDIAFSDLDGDGLIDLAVPGNANSPSSTFSLLRNISIEQKIQFAAPFFIQTGELPEGIAAADFDGDLKPDIAVSYTGNNGGVSIYKNQSVPGSFSFPLSSTLITLPSPSNIVVADIDFDGKPDILIISESSARISIFRNIGGNGVLSFAPKVDIQTSANPQHVAVGDLDGDNKPDIITSNITPSTISIFRNTSTPGNIQLSLANEIATWGGPFQTAIGDLDKDGKQDIVTTMTLGNACAVRRNITGSGTISFSEPVFLNLPTTNSTVYGVTINDLDGDTLPDIAVCYSWVQLFRNSSMPGTLSFTRIGGTLAENAYQVRCGDLDNDGKPDVAATNAGTGFVSVTRNKGNEPFIVSFTPPEVPRGDTVVITGMRFNNINNVYLGDTAATYFSATSNTQIKAVVGNGASGFIRVVNNYGNGYQSGFIFSSPPSINNFLPAAGAAGDTITINGNYFRNIYRVTFGDVPAASYQVISPEKIKAVVSNGASGQIKVYGGYGEDSIDGFYFYLPPVITSFTPDNGDYGTTVVIKGSYFTGLNSVLFGGKEAASFQLLSDTLIQAVVSDGSYGRITVRARGGSGNADSLFRFPAPVISSFSTTKAEADSLIEITGHHFSRTPSRNTVFLGAAPAEVIFADSTLLKIKVPAGTTLKDPVLVVNNMSAEYHTPIKLLFKNNGTPPVFTWKEHFGGINEVREMVVADFNKDGKNDILASGYADGKIVVLKNNTIKEGKFDFLQQTVKPGDGYSSDLNYITTGDLNADGYPDVVYASWFGRVLIYKNTTLNQAISFTTPLTITTGYNNSGVSVTDLDADGLPDVIISTLNSIDNSGQLIIYRNRSRDGNIILAAPVILTVASAFTRICAADIDRDGKPDITGLEYSNAALRFFILRNTSTNSGNFSFANGYSVPIVSNNQPNYFTLSDFNNDDKPDLVTSDFVCFTNNSQPGVLSFSSQTRISYNGSLYHFEAGCFDGDDKNDLVTSDQLYMITFRNTGTGNTIDFTQSNKVWSEVTYKTIRFLAASDFDNDGKQDMAVANGVNETISIFRNQTNELFDTTCAGVDITLRCTVTGTIYQWQINDNTGGFYNISNSATYSGANTATLVIAGTPSHLNDTRFRCLVNGVADKTINLLVKNSPPVPQLTLVNNQVLTVQNTVSGAFYTWQQLNSANTWTDITPAANGTSYTPTESGSYRVLIKADNCTSVSVPFPFLITGLNNTPASSAGIRLFPNPVRNVLHIENISLSDHWKYISIYSMTGENITGSINIVGKKQIDIPLANLAPGCYLVQIKNGEKSVFHKLIKH